MIENTERQRTLVDAFNHLQSAIELLDRADAPGNIAANLDLALHQLGAELARERPQQAIRRGANDAECETVWPFSQRPVR